MHEVSPSKVRLVSLGLRLPCRRKTLPRGHFWGAVLTVSYIRRFEQCDNFQPKAPANCFHKVDQANTRGIICPSLAFFFPVFFFGLFFYVFPLSLVNWTIYAWMWDILTYVTFEVGQNLHLWMKNHATHKTDAAKLSLYFLTEAAMFFVRWVT